MKPVVEMKEFHLLIEVLNAKLSPYGSAVIKPPWTWTRVQVSFTDEISISSKCWWLPLPLSALPGPCSLLSCQLAT